VNAEDIHYVSDFFQILAAIEFWRIRNQFLSASVKYQLKCEI